MNAPGTWSSRRRKSASGKLPAWSLVAGLALAAPAAAAPVTTSFAVTGAVNTPLTETLATLNLLPQGTAAVTYGSGGGPVSATFSGPTLWSVLGSAGLTPVPGAKNSSLRDVAVATGSDGYAVAFSGGELNPQFGGSRNPVLVGTTVNGAPLGQDGFARTVVPGDAAGGRYVSNLSQVNVVQAPDNPSAGGGVSTGFTLSGLVANPVAYTATTLAALPALTETVSYTAAGSLVTASYTGVTLWSLLTRAGLLTDPAIKNDELRFYVLATGSDGYEATFSLGELDPRFGGGGTAGLVAYASGGQPLGTDGFARLVVPGDSAGGRYVSNLVSLQVIDATAVPEPASAVLLGAATLGLLGAVRRRGSTSVVG